MLIGNITVRKDCRWTDQAILHSKISSPLAIKSPAQSLDYHVNSYHIHLNTLRFHRYGKEISRICHWPFCPINTSFSGTSPPSFHSTASNAPSWRRHCLRTPRTLARTSSHNLQSLQSLLLGKKWPSTSSSLRSTYHPPLCCTPVYLQFFLLSTLFFFCCSLFVPSSSKRFRIWPIRLWFLPINLTSNVSAC